MKSKIWILIIVIIILVAGGLVGWKWYEQRQMQEFVSHQFNGELGDFSDSKLVVKGIYTLDITADSPQVYSTEQKTVSIETRADIKMQKTVIYLPSAEDVKDTGGRYDPSKLKREVSVGTLDDLKKSGKGTVVSIVSDKNIYGKNTIKAIDVKEINYTIPVYPVAQKPAK